MKPFYKEAMAFLLLLSICQCGLSQGSTMATIKPGNQPNSVIIAFTPDRTGSWVIDNFTFSLSIPASVAQIPTLQVISSNIPSLGIPNFTFFPSSPYVDIANGRRIWDFNGLSDGFTTLTTSLTNGVEFEAVEVAFAGGVGMAEIMLLDRTAPVGAGCGPDGATQFYLELRGLGYITPDHADGLPYLYATAPGVYGTENVNDANWGMVIGSFATLGSQIILPITFKDFSVRKDGNRALLNWSTATEENNKGFHIERSTSGQSWEVIGFVPGYNNSTVEQRYSFTDNNPKPGIINQYRLRQEDFDGRYDYSAVRKVDFSFKEPVGISIFPNPAGGEGVNISCEGFSSKVNVLLFNSNGILVRRLGNVTAQPSTGNINIETASLSPGLYMVEVTDREGHRAVKKLVRR